MRCFEVTLHGFDPDTSETDHLVKWVLAPTWLDVRLWLAATGLDTCLYEIPHDMDDHASSYDWDDGVDVKLDAQGNAEWNPKYPGGVELWKEQAKCVAAGS